MVASFDGMNESPFPDRDSKLKRDSALRVLRLVTGASSESCVVPFASMCHDGATGKKGR